MPKPQDVVVYNIAATEKIKMLKPEEIDTLVPSAVMNELTSGDESPFFKIEAIEYPAKGSGGIYTKAFFNSFVGITKKRPVPGSKRGHEWISRGHSDFYTVGGKLVDNADGASGVVYLKIYIPPQGDEGSNEGFIRDAKAGIVHFSLVSAPESMTKKDPETGADVRYFTSSKGWERNDAVEYGTGAMKQVVNTQGIDLDLDAAKALIEAGKIDISTNVEGEPIQNGVLYRSALRRLASRANEEDRAVLGELISTIDKSTKGGKPVEKNEIFEALKNLVANAKTNLVEIAEAVGLKALLRNEADQANEATVKVLNEKLGEKPLEALDSILAENSANAVAVVENAVSAITPKTVKNTEGKDVANPAFEYAFTKLNGKKGKELTDAVEELKKNSVMLALQANLADGNSPVYRSAGSKEENQSTVGGDGIPTIKIGRRA